MKLLRFSLLMLLASSICLAQNTITPTGIVQDSDSQAWINGTWSWTLYNPSGGGQAKYTDGSNVPKQTSGSLDATGAFSGGSIPNNAKILPTGTQANLTICSVTSAPNACQTVRIPITSDSPTIGSIVSSLILPPRVEAAKSNYAYNATEILNPVQGTGYTNTVTNSCFLWQNGSYVSCGGASSGTVQAAPQFSVFIQPNPGTHAVAAAASTTQNAITPILQGVGNTDQFASGAGNNGIANFFAANPTGTAMVPPTSTDTEIPNNVAIPSFGALYDYRSSSLFETHHNSQAVNVGGGITCGGVDSINGFSHCLHTVYDLNYGRGFDRVQDVTFDGHGYNLGSAPTSTQLWSTFIGNYLNLNADTRGIKEIFGGYLNSHAIGDNAGMYLYVLGDGGAQASADEGNVGIADHSGETTSYFNGTCATGCTSGSNLITMNFTGGQDAFTDGSYLEDAQTATLTNTVTGLTSVMGLNVSTLGTPLTAGQVSTAWGTLAQSTTSTNYKFQIPISVTLNVTLGTAPSTPGNFTTGPACIVDHFIEQVQITAVGTPSGGVQSITFNSRQPFNSGAVIMQGSLCGQQILVTGAWPASLFVAGAFSTTQLVTVGCLVGSCQSTNLPSAVLGALPANITMFPGAEIIGTSMGAPNTVELGYNTMNVAPGDRLIDPHPSAQFNTGFSSVVYQTTPVNGTTGPNVYKGEYGGPASALANNNSAIFYGYNTAPIDSLINVGAGSTAQYNNVIRAFSGSGAGSRTFLKWEGTDVTLFDEDAGSFSALTYTDAGGIYSFLMGSGSAPIYARNVPNVPSAVGQIPIATSTANNTANYQPVTVSGDGTLSSAGALTVTKSNGNPICTSTGGPCSTGIANVQIVLPTATLAANTCSAVITTTMTGVTTTSTFTSAFATDASAVTGYGSSGGLSIVMWPTANTNNLKVCNPTASSITPGAMTINVGAR